MTIGINAVLLGALYLGLHVANYPISYFLIGTGIIAILDILVIVPFKLWKANQLKISELQQKFLDAESKRSRAKEQLWQLRETGVSLRNEGLGTRAMTSWTAKFNSWHAQVMEQAEIYSPDLRHSLNPIDKISPDNQERIAMPDSIHQKNVSVMSEILARLYTHLNR